MIAKINISAKALNTLSTASPRVNKRAHEKFISRINKHGYLVFENDLAASEFMDYLKHDAQNLPAGVAKRWRELVLELHKHTRLKAARPPLNYSVSEADEFRALSNAWESDIDVAVVDPDTAKTLGVPENDGNKVSPESGFEVTVADVAVDCHHFETFDSLIDRGVYSNGSTRDSFWRDVLYPLWFSSRKAIILDRYLLKGWLEYGWKDEHVQWLARMLAHSRGPQGDLTLICETPQMSASYFDGALETLKSMSSGGRLRSIELVLIPGDWGRRRLPHDRHIRFDSAAVSLHAGFGRLSRPIISPLDGMRWQYITDKKSLSSLQSDEDRCRQKLKPRVIELR